MKANFLALAVAAAITGLASASAEAAIANTGAVGVRGGWAVADIDGAKGYSEDDNDGVGYGIYGDYNITSWFGIEGGFTAFNGFSTKNAGKSYDLDIYGPELALRAALPLDTKGSDVFVRAGAMWAFTSNDAVSGSDDTVAPLVGAGVQYAFNENFAVRAGYDYYFGVYDADKSRVRGVDSDVGLAYIGAQYNFGGAQPEPVVEPAATDAPSEPKLEHYTQNYDFSAGALFPFDGHTLSAQGKQNIAKVVNDVNNSGINNVGYSVDGYTDRLGSDAYNLRLSQKRVQAVAAELQNQGVSAQQLKSVVGHGEADPVTGNKCNGLAKSQLIKCLAPDRRVHITVTGDKVLTK